MASKALTDRLVAELDRQLTINAKLGEGLLKELDRTQQEGRPMVDKEGNHIGISYTPDRDWARCYGHYRGVLATMLSEERERTKLRLLAEKQSGHGVLTDEEYAAEMARLELDAVREMPPEKLIEVVKERGLVVPPLKDRED